MNVDRFLQYLDSQVESGQLSSGTRRKYREAVGRYAEWTDVSGGPVEDMKDFLMFTHMERGNVGSTVNVTKCALGKYLSFQRRGTDKVELREWVNENFRVSSTPRDDYLSAEEAEAFRETAQDDYRAAALVSVFLRTGARVGEVVALDRDDIAFGSHPDSEKKGSIHITRKKRRDNPVTDTRPLLQEDADDIRRYISNMNTYGPEDAVNSPALFITDRENDNGSYRVTEAGVRNMMDSVAEECPHPDIDPERVHPHIFRHTVGYRLGSQGYNATEIGRYLGKASDAERYTHVDESRHEDMAAAL